MQVNKFHIYILLLFLFSCQQITSNDTPIAEDIEKKQHTPIFSFEPTNEWVLNQEISDDFNDPMIDSTKWFVQGKNNTFYKWKGNAPSEYAEHNVFVKNGKLIIRALWQPNFPFSTATVEGRNYENVTTGAIVSKHTFLNGYLEIRAKTASANICSSVWATGYESGLEIFQQIPTPKTKLSKPLYNVAINNGEKTNKDKLDTYFNYNYDISSNVSSAFHTYGCEWNKNYIKLYFDGTLIYHLKREDLKHAWVLNNPLELWIDTQTKPTYGLPRENELPAQFEIDYIRLWQKKKENLLSQNFFGFEGPFENTNLKSLQKEYTHWNLGKENNQLSISSERAASGNKCLKIMATSNFLNPKFESKTKITAIPKGRYSFEAKIWKEKAGNFQSFIFSSENRLSQIIIPLKHLPNEKWVTIKQHFEVKKDTEIDSFTFQFLTKKSSSSTLYVDDIQLQRI
ncbi:family 16 glycosylhydrolase [Flammeovirga kamogawensis]|uniref:Family 16 glycosylhydrolase n=1 Tax=Flammeovirga kamogawensis TaxID=373891 RepID=A0ABX8H2L9_9BACT|nr:family 16 glycosylhydrolase [Flammeovirga kamogawensis]MBB6460265.1 beta-glucanase (GH16 family) [Flammeovirga kamogawensis]QWG10076.1 family 16 glycosylhydrolase [Flammeovirga kamogawensis]TRX65583.1 family 16 glycosylhydrolase [Flammeovirga kamogawensis]